METVFAGGYVGPRHGDPSISINQAAPPLFQFSSVQPPNSPVIQLRVCCGAGQPGTAFRAQHVELRLANGTAVYLGNPNACDDPQPYLDVPDGFSFAGLMTQQPRNESSLAVDRLAFVFSRPATKPIAPPVPLSARRPPPPASRGYSVSSDEDLAKLYAPVKLQGYIGQVMDYVDTVFEGGILGPRHGEPGGDINVDQPLPTGSLPKYACVASYTGAEVPIPDGDPLGVALNATMPPCGLEFANSITVRLNILHTRLIELILTVTSPSGVTVSLSNRTEAPIDVDGLYSFSDDPSLPPIAEVRTIYYGPFLVPGSYRPEGSLSVWNVSTPASLAGTWSLSAVDTFGNDVTGTVRSFEVEVFGGRVNVALRKTAYASSRDAGSTTSNPSRVTDGNATATQSLFQTSCADPSDVTPWLSVDLGSSLAVDLIVIYNTDSAGRGYTLMNAELRVGGIRIAQPEDTPLIEANPLVWRQEGRGADGQILRAPIQPAARGQWVTLQNFQTPAVVNADGCSWSLSIAELEVYTSRSSASIAAGAPVPPPPGLAAAPSPATLPPLLPPQPWTHRPAAAAPASAAAPAAVEDWRR
ncbi:hypothetical protein HYH03_017043 [Edaphochlamys debaryana]|uniref:P/Homo B domain-containing protein n=1 Tax=Edaphochlamys debaryana TaxID=47281 RepID=A0A835XJ80_9CHLO|nr:hypothetical protein HYH03_017043 [Edaphochlamys debaryana]|eukprot:KAG2484162.1 hypothetical protein HYH03_017043 [Edaphochlamys debaryana]